MPPWLRIVAYGVCAWLGLGLLAWLLQRRLQYFPDAGPVGRPPGRRWRDLEAVSFRAEDGVRLEAWFWPARRETVVLLLHGNAGHRGHRLDWMAGLHDRGWPLLLLDYRGYGGSEGHPTETGLLRDADAAVRWLASRGHARVAYLGSSIGCGVAVGLAARRPPAGLVLQSGALSLVEVAQRAYPIFPMRWLLRDRFDVRHAAGRVDCPALCIHGDLDEVVGVDAGRALFTALAGPKTWWEVGGAGHNDVVATAGPAWYERVDAFLDGLGR